MNNVNYSAVALVLAVTGLAANAVVWAVTGYPWTGVGFAVCMPVVWAGRSWAFY